VPIADLYAACFPDVVLHRTIRPKADEIVYQRSIIDESDPVTKKRYVFSMRERLALNEVAQFLTKRPGDDVVMLYGYQHAFEREFGWRWRRRPPQLVVEDFPSARAEFWSWREQRYGIADQAASF
jgi:hypothetical protein